MLNISLPSTKSKRDQIRPQVWTSGIEGRQRGACQDCTHQGRTCRRQGYPPIARDLGAGVGAASRMKAEMAA